MTRGHKNARCDLTAEEVREIFDYDPDEGLLRWKKRNSKRVHVGDVAGVWASNRITIGINGHDYRAHRIIWLWVTGAWPTHEVDHINGNAYDNRWLNLREATSSENLRNRGAQRNNTSGYKGVAFNKKTGKWIAGIKLHGYRHNLGQFNTAEEAYAAYCAAAPKMHGVFAKT